MNLRKSKFIPEPKHFGDLKAQRQMAQAVNALLNGQVVVGQKAALQVTDGNVIWELPPPGGAAVATYVITDLTGDDFYTAATWDGTTLGTNPVYIAKPARMRPSNFNEYFDGIAFTYSPYTMFSYDPFGDNSRTATDASGSEIQVVFPRFITASYLATGFGYPDVASFLAAYALNAQCIVRAYEPVGGTGLLDPDGNAVVWEELSPFRTWAKRFAT